MKARWLLPIGAVAVTFALAGADVVQADQARPRNSEAAGRSSGGSASRGGGGGSSAVSRGGGSSGGSSVRSEPSRPRSAAPRRHSGVETSVSTAQRRAPEYSRPSTGRAVVGRAVPRDSLPGGGGGGGGSIIVRPRTFYPWGFGWGAGYFYDPFWWGPGYWDPFWGPSWGGYSGYGWGPGYWGPGYGGGPGYYGGYRNYEREDRGALRLKVEPREAEVFVDGDFVGEVDDYDGVFQKLHLPPGRHRIQVRADGYEPLEFSVLIVRDQKVTYQGELKER